MSEFIDKRFNEFTENFYQILSAHLRMLTVMSGATVAREDGSTVTVDRGSAALTKLVHMLGNISAQNCFSDDVWAMARKEYQESDNPDFRRLMQNLSTSVRFSSQIAPKEFLVQILKAYDTKGSNNSLTQMESLERLPGAVGWAEKLNPDLDHWYLCLVFMSLTLHKFPEIVELYAAVMVARSKTLDKPNGKPSPKQPK